MNTLMEDAITFAYQSGFVVNVFTSASNKLDGVVTDYDDGYIVLTKYPTDDDVLPQTKSTVIDRYHIVSLGFHPRNVDQFLAWLAAGRAEKVKITINN